MIPLTIPRARRDLVQKGKTMKTRTIFAMLLAVLALGQGGELLAQSPPPVETPGPPATTPTARTEAPATKAPPLDNQIAAATRFQTETVSRILGVNFKVDGVIPRAVRARHPLHLINPFAPAEYGSGLDNVTTDPQTGRANGIRFIGVSY